MFISENDAKDSYTYNYRGFKMGRKLKHKRLNEPKTISQTLLNMERSGIKESKSVGDD